MSFKLVTTSILYIILPDDTSPSARDIEREWKFGGATGGRNKPSGHSDSGSGESTLYGEGGRSGIEMSVKKKETLKLVILFVIC